MSGKAKVFLSAVGGYVMANDPGLLSAPLTKAEAVLFGLLYSVERTTLWTLFTTSEWKVDRASYRAMAASAPQPALVPHSFQKVLKTVLKRH